MSDRFLGLGTDTLGQLESQPLDLTSDLYDVSRYPINSCGGYCDVYLAKSSTRAEHVALKRLRISKDDEKGMLVGRFSSSI